MGTDFVHNSQLMDEAQLKEWILRQMGAPLIKVEVTKEHLCDSVENAMRWFVAKKGMVKYVVIRVQDGRTDYCLPDDVDTVLDVVFSVNPMDISLIFSPFIVQDENVPYDVFAAPQSAGLYSSFVQSLQYVETAKRILGAEPDWRQENRTLHIFPLPKNASAVIVEYKTNTFDINQLNERDHDLVKRYALAWTKRTVGRIRSKYDGFPSAQGQAQLDGRELLEESREEMSELEEEIAASAMPMHFIAG